MIEQEQLLDWFRASTSYINAHRGKTFVILLTGEALEHPNFENIIYDLNLLHSLGVKLVLVHGARPQIDKSLEKQDLDCQQVNSIRITKSSAINSIIETVGFLSTRIESAFSAALSNSPMNGSSIRVCRGNFVSAKPFGIHEGLDYELTGKVRKIHSTAIEQQLEAGNIVLLPNLGYSLTGEVFNLTAEEVATETAIALNAEKLILLTPTEGILDESASLVPSLSEDDVTSYISHYDNSKNEDSKALSKALQAALHAYQRGVHRSHLISYKNNGALLQELFTLEGKGSLISNDNFDSLRPAELKDVAGINGLIKPLQANGSLVARSQEHLETEIACFHVIELEGRIVACAALFPLDAQSGEIACIAIDDQFQKKGYGERLFNKIQSEAIGLGYSKLFALTTIADHWFIEKGFSASTFEELPQSRQQAYDSQRNSKVLIKLLKG